MKLKSTVGKLLRFSIEDNLYENEYSAFNILFFY